MTITKQIDDVILNHFQKTSVRAKKLYIPSWAFRELIQYLTKQGPNTYEGVTDLMHGGVEVRPYGQVTAKDPVLFHDQDIRLGY
jgi:hypothetical protein